MGKAGRRAYGLDDVAIVPSRRTRDPEDVDLSWEIDAFRFDLPVMASAMDGVVSPATAIAIGQLGGVGGAQPRGPVDPLRGSRAAARRDRRAADDKADAAHAGASTASRCKPELIGAADQARSARPASSPAASVTPQRVEDLHPRHHRGRARPAGDPGHGRVGRARHARASTTRSTSRRSCAELDLPVIVGGCSSYQAALHLMRTGAAGVLVGVGAGRAVAAPAACSASACRRPPPSPTPGRPACATSTRPASTSTSSPTAAWPPAATSPRPSCAAPTR